jgi:hypothetical protein
MADPAFRRGQEAALRAPHIKPINDLVDALRDQDGRGWVPYVAPMHGGVNASRQEEDITVDSEFFHSL